MSVRLSGAVAALAPYDPRDLSDAGIRIRLHRNESALPPPAYVLDALRALDGETLRTYPTALQQRTIERLAVRFDRTPEHIALAGGADDILLACARAVLDPGDNAVILAPTFGMYARAIALAGAQVRRVPYGTRWRFEPEAVIAAADERTRLVILGHPNNPTGEALSMRALQRIAAALPEALVLVDEVYLAFSDRSLAFGGASRAANVAVAGSFSKCAALAGARIGYLLAPEPLAAAVRRMLGPYPVSALSLAVADAYLADGAAFRSFGVQLEAQVARSLDAFDSALRPLAAQVWRGPANFLLADCGTEATQIAAALRDDGIAVRAYDDPMLAGMLRFAAADDDATAEVVTALRRIAARERINA
jgi:histidinol-phosphate aminotransferase